MDTTPSEVFGSHVYLSSPHTSFNKVVCFFFFNENELVLLSGCEYCVLRNKLGGKWYTIIIVSSSNYSKFQGSLPQQPPPVVTMFLQQRNLAGMSTITHFYTILTHPYHHLPLHSVVFRVTAKSLHFCLS